MSSATKRKHVAREMDETLVEPSASQVIVRVLAGRGNNLHEVEDGAGDVYLASMPRKLRKNVWVKRGDFVLCEPITEGDKVRAEMCHVLDADNVAHLRRRGEWPARFDSADPPAAAAAAAAADVLPPSDTDSDSEPQSLNRPRALPPSASSTSSDDDDDQR